MRKRHWKNRKNRRCPDCGSMLTYTRKDSFDVACKNNSVCKSCSKMDRKLTMETIEKMKKPKSKKHKKKISQGMTLWWKQRKEQEELNYKEINKWQN